MYIDNKWKIYCLLRLVVMVLVNIMENQMRKLPASTVVSIISARFITFTFFKSAFFKAHQSPDQLSFTTNIFNLLAAIQKV